VGTVATPGSCILVVVVIGCTALTELGSILSRRRTGALAYKVIL
jgi:hypothetical protein